MLKAKSKKQNNPVFGVPLIEVANLGDIEKETNLFNSQRSRDCLGQAKVIRYSPFVGSPTTAATSKNVTETRQNWTGSFGPVGFGGDDSQDIKEILGDNLDIEDYNVIDEQIQRFSQEL